MENVPNCPAVTPLPLYMEVLRWCGMMLLLFMSGSFSGLNLGLMGLDKVALEVIMTEGNAKDRIRAARIMPIRSQGNFLLCTILLGNVAVNSLFSILAADVFDSTVGFLISTFLIVVFGEIVPQAACSRYPLAVGSAYRHFIKLFMLITSPLSWPVSYLLDRVLGEEVGHIYSRKELKKLMDMHYDHEQLTKMEASIMSGVLDFVSKKVQDVMTPMKEVYRLSIETRINFETMEKITNSGHSRVPVYEAEEDNIIGLLYVKDLVLLNPEDNLPLREVLEFCGRPLMKVFFDEGLEKLLGEFKRGSSHLAVVHKVNDDGPGDPFYENTGIVTLEDVIEELINDEILDETDDSINNTQQHATRQNRLANFVRQKSARFRQSLTDDQLRSVEIFLREKIPEFSASRISEEVFVKLMQQVVVEEISVPAGSNVSQQQLYSRGKPSPYFTLVLSGSLEVEEADGTKHEVGTLGYLGVECLKNAEAGEATATYKFIPDYTARVCHPSVKVVRISRDLWQMAQAATSITQMPGRSGSGMGNTVGLTVTASSIDVEVDMALMVKGEKLTLEAKEEGEGEEKKEESVSVTNASHKPVREDSMSSVMIEMDTLRTDNDDDEGEEEKDLLVEAREGEGEGEGDVGENKV